MLILGHTALGYLFGRPLLTGKVGGRQILIIFVFANLIDAVHLGPLRILTHNLIGTALFVCLWLSFFLHYHLIRVKEVPALAAASGAHVLGDWLFSGYAFFYPLDAKVYALYPWGSPEHMIASAVLGAVFLAILLESGDYRALRAYASMEYKRFLKGLNPRRLYEPKLFCSYLLVLFYLASFAQYLVALTIALSPMVSGVWYAWLYTATFTAFICMLSAALLHER
ncbi:MAG: hypothetical protein AB1665_08410 [Candidatus Thermoplasmatota archaeon]